MSTVCPHCSALQELSGNKPNSQSTCSQCGRPLMPREPSPFEDFPAPLLWMCILALFVLLFLVLAAAFSPKIGGEIVGSLALLLLLYWKRLELRQLFQDFRRRSAEKRKRRAEEKAMQQSRLDEDEELVLQQSSQPDPKPSSTASEAPKPRPVPVAPLMPQKATSPSPPVPGNDDITAGLAEPYCQFLLAALKRAEWNRADLEVEAQRHQITLKDALEVIGQWSQKKYQDDILVAVKNTIRIQLPLI